MDKPYNLGIHKCRHREQEDRDATHDDVSMHGPPVHVHERWGAIVGEVGVHALRKGHPVFSEGTVHLIVDEMHPAQYTDDKKGPPLYLFCLFFLAEGVVSATSSPKSYGT